MTTIPASIFKKYDIRGAVDTEMTPAVAYEIGKAYGTYVLALDGKQIYLGRDNRPSSEPLAVALADGVISTGCRVLDIGMVPTPVLYFAATRGASNFGAMVTASHLPSTSNGVKFCRGNRPIYGDAITWLHQQIQRGDYRQGRGSLTAYPGLLDEYTGHLSQQIAVYRSLNIVVDCLNGAASVCAPELMERLGMRVTRLHCDPATPYPFAKPDPSIPANLAPLQEQVRSTGAAVGLAYDGDADRLGVVDDQGRYVFADRVLALLARDVVTRHPGVKVVFDILCSQAVEHEIRAYGGVPVYWKSGHAFIKDKLHSERALLAGESSGHIFFADRYFGYDDAIYAGCRLLELIAASDLPLSAMLDSLLQTVISAEERPHCPDEQKQPLLDAVAAEFEAQGLPLITVDGVRIQFPHGWGLVRASNTEPVLSLRFEATTEAEMQAYRAQVWETLGRISANQGTPLAIP